MEGLCTLSLAEELRRFVAPLFKREDLIVMNYRAPLNTFKVSRVDGSDQQLETCYYTSFDVHVCAFGERQFSCNVVFSSKCCGAVAPEVFLNTSIPDMEPSEALENWTPEDDLSLLRVISHIKKCWNISRWNKFLSIVDENKDYITLKSAVLLESMECLVNIESEKNKSGRALLRIFTSSSDVLISITIDVFQGVPTAIRPLLNIKYPTSMSMGSSIYTPEHINPVNLEDYISRLSELCTSQLSLEKESKYYRVVLISTICKTFEKFVVDFDDINYSFIGFIATLKVNPSNDVKMTYIVNVHIPSSFPVVPPLVCVVDVKAYSRLTSLGEKQPKSWFRILSEDAMGYTGGSPDACISSIIPSLRKIFLTLPSFFKSNKVDA